MKKKHGFTLAEVLITLGIIGVVAALTAPALVQNASNAKIGPTLAKVVSTIENANQKIMLDEGVENLSKISSLNVHSGDDTGTNQVNYANLLSEQVAGSSYSEKKPTGNPNVEYPYYNEYTSGSKTNLTGALFHFSNSIEVMITKATASTYTAKGTFKGVLNLMYIDINGFGTSPNTLGKDVFLFYLDKGGSIIPAGSTTFGWLTGNDANKYSATSGDYACNATKVTTGKGCAGSVFDNNLKVIYQ